MASAYVVLLFFMFFEASCAQQQQSNLIKLGSSLSPTNEPTRWNSSSGRFAFGFYQQGSGYSVGIWLVGTSNPDITVVWTANRDDPSVSSNATLTLTVDGLVLTDQTKHKVIVNTLASPSSASVLDSGNFVVYNKKSDIIWSSFNFPTDTILVHQSLCAGSELFSNASDKNSSTGQFRLKMQDLKLVLYPTNTVDDFTEAYWESSDTYLTSGKLHLYLNYTGDLLLLNDSVSVFGVLYYSDSVSNDSSVIYRATLDYDGIFRLYSHYYVTEGVYNTTIKWSAPDGLCNVKTFCGLNSYCTLYDDQAECLCLPGTDFIDSNARSRGCERNFIDQTCNGRNKNTESYNMTSMKKMTWDDYPYYQAYMSEEDCRKSCLEDCNCDAALHDSSGYCMKNKLPLKYARRDQGDSLSSSWSSSSFSPIAYFKTGLRNISDGAVKPLPGSRLVTNKKVITQILVMSSGLITCSCVFLLITGFFAFKYRVAKYKWLLKTGNFGLTDELILRSFSYNELKKATNGFIEELGRGSFGAVYKGVLPKGEKLVAVKRLEKVMNDGSEKEFRSETHVIGRTHHKNLVRLLGYCAHESKRLLVYEFMSNGSLADLLFRSERFPDWNERVKIALDIARGIRYLHDECEAPIIHCDIKPQNILMDDFWTAKISDFGLAKLLMPDQTRTFTLVRGTRGYMAPEWSKNTPISVKADVYSYGVVLLETVCCRKNLDVNASKPEEIVLITWVYKCFINRELNKLVRDQELDKKTLENLIKVGLWCVQDEPALRPSMKSVVMMLEGIVTDIAIPPCPTDS